MATKIIEGIPKPKPRKIQSRYRNPFYDWVAAPNAIQVVEIQTKEMMAEEIMDFLEEIWDSFDYGILKPHKKIVIAAIFPDKESRNDCFEFIKFHWRSFINYKDGIPLEEMVRGYGQDLWFVFSVR